MKTIKQMIADGVFTQADVANLKNNGNMEIIDSIKQMIADGVLTQEDAEKYFPELVENEDEKIRKELIEYLKALDDNLVGTKQMNSWIAWLEKKSDQKPTWSEKEKPTEEQIGKAANEWERKAIFKPIAMTLDSNGKPNGIKQFDTSHADSFKAGVFWLLKQL